MQRKNRDTVKPPFGRNGGFGRVFYEKETIMCSMTVIMISAKNEYMIVKLLTIYEFFILRQ